MWYYLFDTESKCVASQENEDFIPLADGYSVLTDEREYLDLSYVRKQGDKISFDIPLELFKERRIKRFLKEPRDKEEISPISFNGHRWDIDEKALQRINGAIIALGENGTITWTSADDEDIENVTAEVLRGVITAAAVRSNTLHVKYRQLRDIVEAAATIDDVRAVRWED